MKVLLSESGAEAAERVRKRDGDRSITATVDRLIRESDELVDAVRSQRAMNASSRRAARKGVRS